MSKIKQLIEEAKTRRRGTKERQQVLTELVDEILRSRRICRPLPGQPLSSACQEIYQEARQQLLGLLYQDIDRYNPQQESARQWAKSRLDLTFKQVLDDGRLKTLALEAQHHPPRTQQRQYLLTELVNAIQLSNRLIRPSPGEFSREFYELIYDDAVNRTLLYVFQKIDLYDPQRGDGKFMNWVNFRLDRTFREIKLLNQLPQTTKVSEQEIEQVGQPEATPTVFEILMHFIEHDPEGIFKNEYIRNNPNASFKAIFLAKRVKDQSWKEISEELDIPVTTLSSFYWRCIQRFAPRIRQYVQECA